MQAARELEIPVIATEQYPKGLLIGSNELNLMFMLTTLHLYLALATPIELP